MAEQSWFNKLIAAIEREYERRIRRSSEVIEYGVAHGRHGHHDEAEHHMTPHAEEPAEEAAEIVNLPRGTRLPRATSTPPAGEEHTQPDA